MVETTNEARAEEDQGKDEDKTENKVYIFQSLESKEKEKLHQYVATKNVKQIFE